MVVPSNSYEQGRSPRSTVGRRTLGEFGGERLESGIDIRSTFDVRLWQPPKKRAAGKESFESQFLVHGIMWRR